MPKKISPIAMKRLFTNVNICMHCNARIRADSQKVREGLIKCRKCGSYAIRQKAKERRGATV